METMVNNQNVLHITIGTAIQSVPRRALEKSIDLTHEIQMLKCALLYADKVKLCSLATSFLISVLPFANMNEQTHLEAVKGALVGYGMPYNQAKAIISYYQEVQKKTARTPQEEEFFLRIKQSLEESSNLLKQGLEELFHNAGGEELSIALNSGLVELHLLKTLKSDSKATIQEYFDYISEAMTSDKTYPLLDDTTGKLISTAAKEGKIHLLGTSSHKAKQIGLSAGLISRLPLFENASMDEILDIRKELNKPLTRFRSAIINFSNEIASAPWQEEFPQEVDFIFFGKVEPAILEIEEAIKSNKSLLKLVANALTQGLPGSSIIGLALSQITNVDSLLALTITAGLSNAVYKEIKEKREKREAIENHQLYFYYRAKNLLQNK